VAKVERSEEEQLARLALCGETPNPFPHYLFWRLDRATARIKQAPVQDEGRKGQRCRIVKPSGSRVMLVEIEFEDGFRCIVNRGAIRRL
jgi:hypothetical protein